MCGIFGMSTNKVENLDVNAVHILGIYNIERGKMSCGLSWDGDVQYGLGADKLYTDFIVNREIKPVKIPIMIGHTRQPSYGFAVTEDNSHPFGFGTSKNKEGYEMIFCHNGTLKNHKELARKYNIELSEKVARTTTGGHFYETTRDKIDSEVLGEILYRTKNFKVLSEYIGAAALAWTWIDEPNKLYLWSGASRQTQNSPLVTELEERPMNVYCKDKNNMFFSSLEDSLTVLGASSKDKLQIDYNTVYIITDGDFANAEKHKISRKRAYQSEDIINHNRYSYMGDNYCDLENHVDERKINKTTTNTTDTKNNCSLMTNLHNDKPIHSIIDYRNKIYSKSLRYWENGTVVKGIYIYIKGWGFKYIGMTEASKNSFINNVKGLTFNFNTGVFNYNIKNTEGNIIIKGGVEDTQFYYFMDGVLLKSLEDYNIAVVAKDKLISPNKYIDHHILSYMSKHPVIDMDPTKTITVAIFEGKPFTGNITELGFEKIYYFNNGILTKWVKRGDLNSIKEKPVIILPTTTEKNKFNKTAFDDSIKFIEDFEKTIIEELTSNENLADEKVIIEMITESFEKHSEDVSETIIELSDWKDNEIVKNALNTLNLINYTLKEFVEKPNIK